MAQKQVRRDREAKDKQPQENVPTPSKKEEKEIAEQDSAAAPSEEEEKIRKLVDEIDDVLEENAEEVVTKYVQRGGE